MENKYNKMRVKGNNSFCTLLSILFGKLLMLITVNKNHLHTLHFP